MMDSIDLNLSKDLEAQLEINEARRSGPRMDSESFGKISKDARQAWIILSEEDKKILLQANEEQILADQTEIHHGEIDMDDFSEETTVVTANKAEHHITADGTHPHPGDTCRMMSVRNKSTKTKANKVSIGTVDVSKASLGHPQVDDPTLDKAMDEYWSRNTDDPLAVP